jgi:hypothetical protein
METTDTSPVRVSPEQSSLQSIDRVAGSIANGGRLSEEDQQFLETVLLDHKQHLQGIRVAVARHRAQRLFSLSNFVRLIEDELMRLNLQDLDPGQKIRLYTLLRNAMMEDLDFLEKVEGTIVIQKDHEKAAQHLHLHVHGKEGEVTPDGRERIRTLFSRIVKLEEQKGATNGR